jgi:hypothetical protein
MTQPESLEKSGKPKQNEILVDGRIHNVDSDRVTFLEVVTFAYPDKAGDTELTFFVTFRKAHNPKEGSLAEGGTVTVKNKGTIFNVTFTRRS